MMDASSGNEADGEAEAAATSAASPFSTSGAGPAHHDRNLAADKQLGKQCCASSAAIVISTLGWIIFELSGIPLLSICSDVLILLIIVLFLNAKYEAYTNKKLQSLPELALSEEMVQNVASTLCVKINDVLFLAHDIAQGNNFGLFFKVVACLWLLSVAGGYLSFLTLAYIGGILSITVLALYGKYREHVDNCCTMIHRKILKVYTIVYETVSRIPRAS